MEYEKAVNDVLPSKASERVLSLVAKYRKTTFMETKWRHTEKINKPIKRKKESGSDVDLSGEQLKKWVKNISDRELTLQQTKVLAKGLNFAVLPDKVPVDEFVMATEKACWLLPENEAEELRSEVSGILKNAKPPPSNLT